MSARRKRMARVRTQFTHRTPAGEACYMTAWDALINGLVMVKVSIVAAATGSFIEIEIPFNQPPS